MVTRTFLLVNLGVLLLNAGLGIYVNLGVLPFKTSLRERFIVLSEGNRRHRENINASIDEGPSTTRDYGISDASGNFTYHTFTWPGRLWADLSSTSNICLASQTSVDRLFWLAWQAEAWTGILSVAVYAPGADLGVAVQMIEYLRKCFPGVRERTSLHLAYPKAHQDFITSGGLEYDADQLDCNSPESVNRKLVKLHSNKQSQTTKYPLYPQNILRNIARRTCPTSHTFTVDIDMLVTPDMSKSMETFLGSDSVSNCYKCTFVVPAYEIHESVAYPPEDKGALLELIKKKLAQRFHIKVYDKNQGNSHLNRWEIPLEIDNNLTSRNGNTNIDNNLTSRNVNSSVVIDSVTSYKILYNITTYEEFWEPPLVLPSGAPGFDERFIGYGFTRNSEVYELKLRGYSFSMLDGAFLSHRGFQSTKSYSPARKIQIQINKVRYQAFKRELHARYNLPPPKPLAPSPDELAAINAKQKLKITKPVNRGPGSGYIEGRAPRGATLIRRQQGRVVIVKKIPSVLQNLQSGG